MNVTSDETTTRIAGVLGYMSLLLARSGPLRLLSTYADSELHMVSRDCIEVVTSDGQRLKMSRAAASLSDAWSEQEAIEEGTVHVAVPSRTLQDLSQVAEALVSRFFTPRPASASSSAVELLRALSLPRRIAVLRAAKFLEFRTVACMAATAISEVLRGRSADVLRVVLDAPTDLTPEERAAALSEPLLTPPTAEDEAAATDDGDYQFSCDDACWASCLADLDARSLRTLKAVSRAWRARARRVLGDESSAWRGNPEWSAGCWAAEWFLPRLSSEDEMMQKRALLTLDSLEATVELPQFLPELLPHLSAESRSSARALTLRALSRMEAPTLELHGDALRTALAENLEPHEAEAPQSRLLMAKLGMIAFDAPAAEGGDDSSEQACDAKGRRKRSRSAAAAGSDAQSSLPPNDLRRKLAKSR